MKKLLTPLLIAVILLVGATSAWATVAAKTPAEITADLTGKTVEEVYEQKTEENKTFGQLAAEADKLEEFKQQMLESKKAIIEQRVKDGLMTQEQADAFIEALEERMAACDGNGTPRRLGRQYGAGFGRGVNGLGCGFDNGNRGFGKGMGFGRGAGRGFGKGLQNNATTQ